jgi:aspartate kinase
MKVVKFGGSSLAAGNSVDKALNIVKNDPERKVIVVTAPGKRTSDDLKVTDLLITYAYTSLRSNNYQDIVNKIYSATN